MRQLLNTLFVTSEDAYLSLENENVVVSRGEDVLAKIPLRSLEGILSFSYKGASPALMGKCSETSTGISFFSPRGRYYCSILGESNRNVLLRRDQFRIADDESRALSIAKSFVIGKISTVVGFLNVQNVIISYASMWIAFLIKANCYRMRWHLHMIAVPWPSCVESKDELPRIISSYLTI